jgi:NADH-quinone oxidoreductase subunit G
MPTFTINGQEVTVDPGTNLLEAAKTIGVEVPHYCYHPALKVVASCRMCFVEVTQEVRGRTSTRLMTACNTMAGDGMVVETESDHVKKARGDILEFLLINHPLDCPVCDQAGECKLQDYAFQHGTGFSRFGETKRFKSAKKLGSGIRLFTNRCVLCDRCVRFLGDYVGTGELTISNMGNNNEISTFPGKPIDNKLATNVVDLCPVGALLSEDFLFKTRVWNLRSMPSVCAGCSRGCNTYLDTHNGTIQRTRPRENLAVNDYFICDPGRFTYHVVQDEHRIEQPLRKTAEGQEVSTWDDALSQTARKLAESAERAVVLVSTHLTIEEMDAAKELASTIGTKRVEFIPNAHVEEQETFPGGFVIEADKSPNTAGAERIIGKQFAGDLPDNASAFVANSSVDVGNIADDAVKAIGGASFVAVVDVLNGPLASQSDVVLAGRMWAEKAGRFVNSQGHEQSFKPSVLGPVNSRGDRDIMRDLAARIAAIRSENVEAVA